MRINYQSLDETLHNIEFLVVEGQNVQDMHYMQLKAMSSK